MGQLTRGIDRSAPNQGAPARLGYPTGGKLTQGAAVSPCYNHASYECRTEA